MTLENKADNKSKKSLNAGLGMLFVVAGVFLLAFGRSRIADAKETYQGTFEFHNILIEGGDSMAYDLPQLQSEADYDGVMTLSKYTDYCEKWGIESRLLSELSDNRQDSYRFVVKAYAYAGDEDIRLDNKNLYFKPNSDRPYDLHAAVEVESFKPFACHGLLFIATCIPEGEYPECGHIVLDFE